MATRKAPQRQQEEPPRDDVADEQVQPPRNRALPPPDEGQALVLRGLEYIQHELVERGIAKNRRNQEQKYQFRGIDDVMEVLSALLVRARVIVTPCVLERITEQRQKKDYVQTHTSLRVAYTFKSLQDGSTHTGLEAWGEGVDSGDKGTAKAMSMAYKSAMIQQFNIPINGQDTDGDYDSPGDGDGAGEEVDDSPRISAQQAGLIAKTAKDMRISLDRITALYRVDAITDMTTSQFEHCMEQFEITRKKREQEQ